MTWENVPLGTIAELNPRSASRTGPSTFLGMADLGEDGQTTDGVPIEISDLKSGYTPFANGDLLVAKITPCFENGKIGQVRIPTTLGWGSTEFHVIRPNDETVDRRFLLHFLRSPAVRANGEMRMTGSAGQRRVPIDYLKSLGIPLPPLPEQRRIAAILDEADALRRPSQHAFRMLAVLDGALLEQSATATSELMALGSVIIGSQNGLYKPSTAYGHGVPIIRIDSFDGHSTGVNGTLKRVEVSREEAHRFRVEVGDILVNRVNAMSHLGKSTLVTEVSEPTVFESNMMKIRVDTSKVEAGYLAAWLRSANARAQLRRKAKQAINQASVNQSDVASLTVPALPLAEQRDLTERLAAVEHQRVQERLREASLRSLFTSLQHRAFRGEL